MRAFIHINNSILFAAVHSQKQRGSALPLSKRTSSVSLFMSLISKPWNLD